MKTTESDKRCGFDDAKIMLPQRMPDIDPVSEVALAYMEPLTQDWQTFTALRKRGYKEWSIFDELVQRGLIEGAVAPTRISRGAPMGSQYWFRSLPF